MTPLCECGCGQEVSLIKETSRVRGRIAGQPNRFIPGHNGRVHPHPGERVLARCVRDGECLVWTGAPNPNGYGKLSVLGKQIPVHRIAYEYLVGPIPPGHVIDHVKAKGCRFPTCCEPTHLEPVRQRENVRRGIGNPVAENMTKTHCKRGHPFTADNVMANRGGRLARRCKACARQRWNERVR